MLKLFVDANIFLNFFREDMPKFHGLIASLEELRPHLLVTERVAAEVRRNKVKVALSTLEGLRKGLEFPAIRVPQHLGDDSDATLEALNRDLAETFGKVKALKQRFGDYRDALVRQIARSEDRTSRALERIFSGAIGPDEQELDRAKTRHLCGDPPGKPGDPLGDQVSWEQVLSAIGGGDEVWLVTNDADYFDTIATDNLLNAMLAMEATSRAQNAAVPRVFSKLIDAIEATRTALAVAAPGPAAIVDAEAIREEEATRGTSFASPNIAHLLQTLSRLAAEKSPQESILHHLLKGEDVASYREAIARASDKIWAQARETAVAKRDDDGTDG